MQLAGNAMCDTTAQLVCRTVTTGATEATRIRFPVHSSRLHSKRLPCGTWLTKPYSLLGLSRSSVASMHPIPITVGCWLYEHRRLRTSSATWAPITSAGSAFRTSRAFGAGIKHLCGSAGQPSMPQACSLPTRHKAAWQILGSATSLASDKAAIRSLFPRFHYNSCRWQHSIT